MGWGVLGSGQEKVRDRASARQGLCPTLPDREMGYVSIPVGLSFRDQDT